MQFELGTKIRELRRKCGYTQEKTAEMLGVTPQAVSRWESGQSCPDVMMIPSIANLFGVTIDELFGYMNERPRRIDGLAERLDAMLEMNNGRDVNIDECIMLAREAVMEYPGSGRIILRLASALMRAGYVRRGERHLLDREGYSVYDTAAHSTYPEWREAMVLYEKALPLLEAGQERHRAVEEMMQLYLNVGQREKALALAQEAPGIWGSRPFLKIQAADGNAQVAAYGEALLEAAGACALLMVRCVMAWGRKLQAEEKARAVQNAIGIMNLVCTDGNYGDRSGFVARLQMLLSVYLWADGKQDEAFDALEEALKNARRYDGLQKEEAFYTAPLIRLTAVQKKDGPGESACMAAQLAEEWPAWCVPEEETVRAEMVRDGRWQAWVRKIKQ